jgi:hypothetical protein
MTGGPQRLRGLAAERLAALMQPVPIGSGLSLESGADLSAALERLIPDLLREEHPEWTYESLDGFYFASATKVSETSAELFGTCILISDQTVTPFVLNLSLKGVDDLQAIRIRLGEPGGGRLGISGPTWGSDAAWKLNYLLAERLSNVEWAYDLTA